jgi:hypothetical protein
MQVKAALAYCECHQDATKTPAGNFGQPKILGEADGRTAAGRTAPRTPSLPLRDAFGSHRAATGAYCRPEAHPHAYVRQAAGPYWN